MFYTPASSTNDTVSASPRGYDQPQAAVSHNSAVIDASDVHILWRPQRP